MDRTITFRTTSGGDNQDGHANIFGDLYDPPVIRLRDGTFTGNPSAGSATPVLRLVNVDPDRGSAWSMFATLRKVRIDLGNNTWAAGLAFPAAQDASSWCRLGGTFWRRP